MLTESRDTRFQNHVGFDNLPIGEATKHNLPSLTLNIKHKGYKASKRSRSFMAGVDENAYSDYALEWLLDELVDDGDEVVCVRVLEKEVRASDQQYQEEAQALMQSIIAKNTTDKALSFVLEYAAGKLHGTFQKLIHMHEPAMLVVGTRGRSLGGLHGLVNTRNSFSKYCLQYSPVPVVVVRPTEKRNKKKVKRANDATRQTYITMLAATHGKHEADSEASSTYDLETQFTQDEEAHQVAKALGLPAAFDPTIKPLNHPQLRSTPRIPSSPSLQTMHEVSEPEDRSAKAPLSPGSDSSDTEDEEAEFDVANGKQLLDQQKMAQLHKMEVGEAAALRRPVSEDEDSDDESPKDKAKS